ncbi:unnamed protein product, partial [Meganyctiphanes norvegica]
MDYILTDQEMDNTGSQSPNSDKMNTTSNLASVVPTDVLQSSMVVPEEFTSTNSPMHSIPDYQNHIPPMATVSDTNTYSVYNTQHVSDVHSQIYFEIVAKSDSHQINIVRHPMEKITENPYVCSHCDMAYSDSCDLIKHLDIHTDGEKQHQYSQYASKEKRFHIKNQMTHSGEKPYECSICDLIFPQNSDLVSHLRTHTG